MSHPKPTRLKILEGNKGKRRLNDREPMPKRGRPVCPSWLDVAAKAKWRALVPELDRLGLLTIVDGDTLAAYCQSFAEFQAATKILKKEGRVFKTATGYMAPHPAISMQRSALQHIRAFAALFGLDPADRGRMSTPVKSDETDPFEEFLKNGSKP